MTREKTKKAREVMQHFEEGGKIQARWRTPANSEWKDTELPSWNWDLFDYKIKPVPMKVTEKD